jgi:hypothetical protein
MLTSSPTTSASSSPSAAFHPHSRPYHASRRASPSSRAHSPRFQAPVSSASSRRLDASPHQLSAATSPHPPVPAFAPSPQISKRREYRDSATQYTPPGFPPTYHPPPPSHPDANSSLVAPATVLPPTSNASAAQGETSAAESVTTEPPEPALRVEPQPVAPARSVRPAERTPKHVPRQDGQQDEPSATAKPPTSPAKRARPQDANAKVMPLKYETCDVRDLGVLISDMLMELVRMNDGLPLRDGQLTRFHSRYSIFHDFNRVGH